MNGSCKQNVGWGCTKLAEGKIYVGAWEVLDRCRGGAPSLGGRNFYNALFVEFGLRPSLAFLGEVPKNSRMGWASESNKNDI